MLCEEGSPGWTESCHSIVGYGRMAAGATRGEREREGRIVIFSGHEVKFVHSQFFIVVVNNSAKTVSFN